MVSMCPALVKLVMHTIKRITDVEFLGEVIWIGLVHE
jgi:hypothetical protein